MRTFHYYPSLHILPTRSQAGPDTRSTPAAAILAVRREGCQWIEAFPRPENLLSFHRGPSSFLDSAMELGKG